MGYQPQSPLPRVLDRQAAAEYCGYKSAAGFDAWARRTLGVEPLPDRRGMYDRRALDVALDRVSGIGDESSAVDEYFRRHAG